MDPLTTFLLSVVGAVLSDNRTSSGESFGEAPSGVLSIPGVSGVFTKPGVNLTKYITDFLSRLRGKLDFDLVITSGYRTPREQAVAMYNNYQGANSDGKKINGKTYTDGKSYFEALYGKTLGGKFYTAAQEGVSAMTTLVEEVLADGQWQNGHLAGKGFDVSVRNLTGEQRVATKTAGKELGAHITDEGDHIHMEHITSEPPDSRLQTPVSQPEQTWTEWLASFIPSWGEPAVAHSESMATFSTSAGVNASLVAASGEELWPGEVPAGTYELHVPGKPPVSVKLVEGKTYKASVIGRLFEIR